VPILDTGLVTVVRLLEGRPIYQGGRDHSSHRLVRYGLSEKHAVLLLALIATCIGGSSLAYNVLGNTRYTIAGVVLTFVLLVQFASFLADVERRPVDDGGTLGLTQAFAVHWRRIVEVVVDFGVITGSFVAAYLIEFGWPGSVSQRFIGGLTLPVLLAARYLTFIPFGLYRSIWRYAGARDALSIACAVVISEVVTLSFMVQTQNMRDFSRSFFIVDALICMVAVTGSRFAERAIVNGVQSMRSRTGRRTLIVGAGRTGRSLMRELRETAGERVVGFADDNPRLRRRRVHGVQVLGTLGELPRLLERTEPDIVLITIPNAPRERLDLVVDACTDAGVSCRFVRREVDLDPRVVLGSAAE
jgi:UDP-GlcNAc:undecaprenyl-phosphate GlcNAc-1-phosphate transferase